MLGHRGAPNDHTKHRDLRKKSRFTCSFTRITHTHVFFHPALSNGGADVRRIIGERTIRQWLELDHTLVELWESRSIRPNTLYYSPEGMEEGLTRCIGCLLPGITGREIIDLARFVANLRSLGLRFRSDGCTGGLQWDVSDW